jgi:hypothetical protein
LNIRWQPNDSGGATAILTGLEHTNIIDLLKRDRTAKVLGQPGIAFIPPLPGQTRQGGASILKPVQIAGTNAQTGVALHVKASLASDTNSVNLDLNVEFRELVDASLLHDGSQNQIRTTQATVTTTLTLKPNQTIIIKPVYGGGLDSGTAASGSRRLLVFVTPQIKPTVVRLQNIVRTAASSTK